MKTYEYPLFPGRPGKEQVALQELFRRFNCNDRRDPDRQTVEYTRKTRQLAAATFLGAVL
ncbi:hypothetical protein [Streptomyces sp. NL15-2K]|uniref:hypothetical protein n=1 Tax=Streptomyces sp. NL15-2K TaxID=376149 RepID=UPI000F56496D|nr:MULTISPECIES: hypothetical protein [Actinomycetes]WKX13846.1 hypothetical protein Q4V64_42500 [Kutzneria buriramensis]